jgi:hypothetical protein
MTASDFSISIVVPQNPQEVFNAMVQVRGWWSEEIEGSTDRLHAEFQYHYEDIHRCSMKIIEFIPGQKVVWYVTDNFFKFTNDKTEWTGTTILFEITEIDNNTQLRFTHRGLVPSYECYPICRDAWTNYIEHSLYSLITTGKGHPNATGRPQTEEERRLGSR